MFFQIKRKMIYLALYALPDISEEEEDLEICLHELTQDEAQKILIAKLSWVAKYFTNTQSIQLNLKLKTRDPKNLLSYPFRGEGEKRWCQGEKQMVLVIKIRKLKRQPIYYSFKTKIR